MRPGVKPKPIFIIQHAPHERPGMLERELRRAGARILLVRAYRGERFPKISAISGLVSLGGPMGANDEALYPWITKECSLIKQCVTRGLPVVGICLGAQMMAKALGGYVVRNNVPEVGWFKLKLTAKGASDPIAGAAGASPLVYQWHADTFFLPKNALLLASSEACGRQAFRVGKWAYGFQFHPEVDARLLRAWLKTPGAREEISRARKVFGGRSVQSPSLQRKLAVKGEAVSKIMVRAIVELFQGNHKP